MAKQFELTLTNGYRNFVGVVGALGLIWLLVQGGQLVGEYARQILANPKPVLIILLLLVVSGSILAIMLLPRKLGGRPTLVTIGDDELIVQNRKSGTETHVAYAAVASYTTSFNNHIEKLTLYLRDGTKVELAIDNLFQAFQIDAFWGMVRAFEAALPSYQARQRPGLTPVSLKEPDFVFFASMLATILLVIITVGWGMALWRVLANHLAIGGGFFLLSFGFLVYGALWYDSRSLRRR